MCVCVNMFDSSLKIEGDIYVIIYYTIYICIYYIKHVFCELKIYRAGGKRGSIMEKREIQEDAGLRKGGKDRRE